MTTLQQNHHDRTDDARAASRSLRPVELLRRLTTAELRALEQRCRWRRYAPGEWILDRSSDDREVFFVVEGSVRVVDFSPSGREVVYAEIGVGGHFGELSAIDGLARSASVVALEDCLLASLPPTQFESLIHARPAGGDGAAARLGEDHPDHGRAPERAQHPRHEWPGSSASCCGLPPATSVPAPG